jgi:hypothetical protein
MDPRTALKSINTKQTRVAIQVETISHRLLGLPVPTPVKNTKYPKMNRMNFPSYD